MSRKLLVIKEEAAVWTALYEDERLVSAEGSPAVSLNDKDRLPCVGDIYVGRVVNIVKNINSAFVEIRKDLEPVYLDLSCIKDEKIHLYDELIVQIAKDAVKSKRAVASCEIQLPGNYLILVHKKNEVSVSSKIKNKKRKNELKELVETLISPKDCGCGFILRTNSQYADNEDILNEGRSLINLYMTVMESGKSRTVGTMLYKEPVEYLCDIRNLNQSQVDEIVVEDEELYVEIKEYLEKYIPSSLNKLVHYKDEMISLKSLYGFGSKLSQALKSRVWLKSGAYLVIEPTEAMVVIDVNTGKAIAGKKSKEETIFKINMEAAVEIAFQLRLRNLSGIIIIDFIDMENLKYKEKLLKAFEEKLLTDPVKTCLVDMTALNLVEVTRKKKRRPLYETVNIIKEKRMLHYEKKY